MRKTLLATALAAAFPIAFAQAPASTGSVELYGIVDIGVEKVDSGDVSATRVSSGISAGSRIGVRGRESLGGGYSALFTLENRLEADNGQFGNRAPIYYCANTAAGTATVVSCPGVTFIPATGPYAVPAAALVPGPSQPAVVAGSAALNQGILQAITSVNGVNAIFDRQAFAGLITPFGAILLGRQYTPGYEVLNKFNSFADATAGQMGQGYATLAIRANNAIQYRAEAAGFTASLMYGFGGTDGSRNERSTDPTGGDDFVGANLQYATKVFSVGVGYNKNYTVVSRTTPDEAAKNNTKQTGLETLNVGGTVSLGPARLFLQYMNRKNENPVLRPQELENLVISAGAGAAAALGAVLASYPYNPWDVDAIRGFVGPTKTKVYHVGVTWNVGPGTLHGAVNQAKDTARSAWATQDAEVLHYGIAYFYNLSRRSQLYGAYAVANNKDQGRVALGSAGYAGGATTAFGADSSAIQLGIRHSF
jgi:predicted porin